jgi:hypothetical protein
MSYQLSFSNEFAGKHVYFNFKRDAFLFENLTGMYIFSGMDQLDEESIKYPRTEEALLNALPNEPSRLEKKLRHIAIRTNLYSRVRCLLVRYQSLQSVTLRELEVETMDLERFTAEEAKLSETWQDAFLKKANGRAKIPSIEWLKERKFNEKFDTP